MRTTRTGRTVAIAVLMSLGLTLVLPQSAEALGRGYRRFYDEAFFETHRFVMGEVVAGRTDAWGAPREVVLGGLCSRSAPARERRRVHLDADDLGGLEFEAGDLAVVCVSLETPRIAPQRIEMMTLLPSSKSVMKVASRAEGEAVLERVAEFARCLTSPSRARRIDDLGAMLGESSEAWMVIALTRQLRGEATGEIGRERAFRYVLDSMQREDLALDVRLRADWPARVLGPFEYAFSRERLRFLDRCFREGHADRRHNLTNALERLRESLKYCLEIGRHRDSSREECLLGIDRVTRLLRRWTGRSLR